MNTLLFLNPFLLLIPDHKFILFGYLLKLAWFFGEAMSRAIALSKLYLLADSGILALFV
jgi:hypothetical protein